MLRVVRHSTCRSGKIFRLRILVKVFAFELGCQQRAMSRFLLTGFAILRNAQTFRDRYDANHTRNNQSLSNRYPILTVPTSQCLPDAESLRNRHHTIGHEDGVFEMTRKIRNWLLSFSDLQR